MLPINLLVVEDHSIIRAGICALLKNIASVTIIGEASDGYEALELVDSLKPDVVFMDISLPKLNGLEATSRITQEYPFVRVIILSMHASEDYVLQALRAGASGYLSKDADTDELESALIAVTQGKTYLSPGISKHLANYVKGIDEYSSPLDRLTNRQRDALQRLAEGCTTKQIAGILNRSVKTIETHRTQLLKKIDAHDIAGLVRFAIRMGVVTADQ